MDIKNIILRHIKSAGFQKRWRNIYWPLIKRAVAYIYNKPIDIYTQKTMTPPGAIEKMPPLVQKGPELAKKEVEPIPYEDAIEIIKKIAPEVQHEQGRVGSCVSWANVNMHRIYLRATYGASPELAHMDIYMDRKTPMLDNGMYPPNASRMVVERGIALYLDGKTIPHCFDKECLQKVTRKNYPSKKYDPVRIKVVQDFYDYYPAANKFDLLYTAMAEDFKKHGPRAHQFSIKSYQGWWSGEWPKATGKILGGHRIAIYNVPTVSPFTGEKLLLVQDSAYSKFAVWSHGIKGLKHLVKKEAEKLMTSFTVYSFIFDNKKKKLPARFYALTAVTLKKGEQGPMVKLLQEYLIYAGFSIPDGPTDYFGNQTQEALRQWQIMHLGKDYGGKYWGPISQQKMKEIFAG